jgi:hypothetical protein
MIGEFKVDLKDYDQTKMTAIFAKEYPDALELAYTQSSFRDGKTYPQAFFCSGTFAGSKLLLICTMQADMLRCIVETTDGADLATEALKDVKKAVTLTLEAYIGLIVILTITVLFQVNKKEFTFTI